ncbi:tRNA (adenosine(37)-N6)-dimethylallyltransferase MiaA [Nakamurella flavida]|uniref:tRNA dimethylallyltransferase n=1 Tax=Nakamurella flavida TaxID=363630 RepID=A0A938YP53_9ACTN|nr:tRNA (adenosine(37)-N6)-dimethylallyltransferase MiaA [Nakamurella flavida]MBM9478323.1 tRNA (adenosine(37)-N6)-dimethylallyltransferase MiaA [Nakamurella flavida]MDP9777506.1 tRNA dimethylallyltransferase [Nakamurella flavida]
MTIPPPLVVVTGPTGVGKSELGLRLAEHLGGEVINADSMQLYRGMDIGTAKLTVSERRGIPHHLLDVLDVRETATVAAYQRDTRTAVEGIRAAGRVPILVGGSGLYIQAVVDEIEFPGTDPQVRARLEAELTELGAAVLFARLERVDPAAAEVIESANGRRIVRALEVNEVTGGPFRATLRPGPPRYDAVLLRLDRDTTVLDAALERRVRGMVADGWLEEVRTLAAAGLREGFTARRALGYPQLLAVLDGRADLDAAITETVVATRRFVRRQRSWLRRDLRMIDLDVDEPGLVDRALREVRAAGSTLGTVVR